MSDCCNPECCECTEDGLVTIPTTLYKKLLEDSEFLDALRAAGVDNWEGYSYAFELLETNRDDT